MGGGTEGGIQMSATPKFFFYSATNGLHYFNFCRPMERKKNHKNKNPTNTWLSRTKRGFGGWVLKVVETEKPSWKASPAPTPKPHFFSARGDKREGDKGAAFCLLTPDFVNGMKSSGRRAVRPSRTQLTDSAHKITRKKPKAFISVQPTRVAESARAAGD